jgi:hypothetical protein
LAGLDNQGLVKGNQEVRLRAWMVSLCAHAVVLSVFAAVNFSPSVTEPVRAAAVVSISQAAALAEMPAVVPKPKIAPVDSGKPLDVTSRLVPDDWASQDKQDKPIVRTTDIAPQADARRAPETPSQETPQQVELPKPVQPEPQPSSPAPSEILPAQTEFFGSTTQGRSICYVVDCSGSMQGLWRRVRTELFKSIGRLQQDQYFSVIVFGSDRILESGGGKLVRATDKGKKDAFAFLDSLRPAGATNALPALLQAFKVRDETGDGPSVVYFLTDGFELGEQDGSRFAHRVATMRRSFSPRTQINTIGLWPNEQDSRTLKELAGENSGQFVIINDEDQ